MQNNWINSNPVNPITEVLENWAFREENHNQSQPLSIYSNLETAIKMIEEIREHKRTAQRLYNTNYPLIEFTEYSM